jgi:hypothetical protein
MEASVPSALFGSASPMVEISFRVPESRLQEAKDALCARGILCEVSERLLRRTFEEVVKPLLGNPSANLDRLTYLVGINNKETVRSLFTLTLEEEGGRDILERLAFLLAGGNVPALKILVRVLSRQSSKAFAEHFLLEMASGSKEIRLGLLETIKELPLGFPREEALALSLRDADLEVRDAAREALYSLKHTDYDFDPEAPEEEREEAIGRFLKAARLR